jgi:hypothetical protein
MGKRESEALAALISEGHALFADGSAQASFVYRTALVLGQSDPRFDRQHFIDAALNPPQEQAS